MQEVSAVSEAFAEGMKQEGKTIEVISAISENTFPGSGKVSTASQQQLVSMEEITSSASSLFHMVESLQVVVGNFKYTEN